MNDAERKARHERLWRADHQHLWHPFTQMQDWLAEEPLIVDRAEGVHLVDTLGNRYLDGVSSLWCNVHGHRVAEIDAAIRAQLDRSGNRLYVIHRGSAYMTVLSLPALGAALQQISLYVARGYGIVREQFGLQIGKFHAVAGLIAKMAVDLYATDAALNAPRLTFTPKFFL